MKDRKMGIVPALTRSEPEVLTVGLIGSVIGAHWSRGARPLSQMKRHRPDQRREPDDANPGLEVYEVKRPPSLVEVGRVAFPLEDKATRQLGDALSDHVEVDGESTAAPRNGWRSRDAWPCV